MTANIAFRIAALFACVACAFGSAQGPEGAKLGKKEARVFFSQFIETDEFLVGFLERFNTGYEGLEHKNLWRLRDYRALLRHYEKNAGTHLWGLPIIPTAISLLREFQSDQALADIAASTNYDFLADLNAPRSRTDEEALRNHWQALSEVVQEGTIPWFHVHEPWALFTARYTDMGLGLRRFRRVLEVSESVQLAELDVKTWILLRCTGADLLVLTGRLREAEEFYQPIFDKLKTLDQRKDLGPYHVFVWTSFLNVLQEQGKYRKVLQHIEEQEKKDYFNNRSINPFRVQVKRLRSEWFLLIEEHGANAYLREDYRKNTQTLESWYHKPDQIPGYPNLDTALVRRLIMQTLASYYRADPENKHKAWGLMEDKNFGMATEFDYGTTSFSESTESQLQASTRATAGIPAAVARLARNSLANGSEHPDATRIAKLIPQAFVKTVESIQGMPNYAEGHGTAWASGLTALLEVTCAFHLQPGAKQFTAEEVLDFAFYAGEVGTLARYLDAEAPSIDAFTQALTPQGTGWLQFVAGNEADYWILLDQKGVTILPCGSSVVREGAARRLSSQLDLKADGKSARGLRAALESLSEFMLPKDVVNEIRSRGWSRIHIGGLVGLMDIPFDMLFFGEDGHVGDLFAVDHLPSAVVALALAKRRGGAVRPKTPRMVAYIAPGSPGWTDENPEGFEIDGLPLPFGNRHRKILFDDLSGWQTEIRIDKDATVQSLAMDTATRPALVHLIAHGGLDRDILRSPGVVLFDEVNQRATLVTHTEYTDWNPGEITILTACSTARSADRRGDDGAHFLPGAMLQRGGTAVFTAAKPIDYEFGLHFSRGIKENLGTALSGMDALRATRAAQKTEELDTDRFLIQIIGLADRPIPHDPHITCDPATARNGGQAPSRTRKLWIAGALIGLACLGGAAILRRQNNISK